MIKFVVDTNVLISQLLWPQSSPGKAFYKALSLGSLLMSKDVLNELVDVLFCKKFDPYISFEERKQFIQFLSLNVEDIQTTIPLKVCRDPKDDKFLSLAVLGQANFILTGDKDLLELDVFHGVRIIESSVFLKGNMGDMLITTVPANYSFHEERTPLL